MIDRVRRGYLSREGSLDALEVGCDAPLVELRCTFRDPEEPFSGNGQPVQRSRPLSHSHIAMSHASDGTVSLPGKSLDLSQAAGFLSSHSSGVMSRYRACTTLHKRQTLKRVRAVMVRGGICAGNCQYRPGLSQVDSDQVPERVCIAIQCGGARNDGQCTVSPLHTSGACLRNSCLRARCLGGWPNKYARLGLNVTVRRDQHKLEMLAEQMAVGWYG